MVEIRELDQSYKGYLLEFQYCTDSYYDIVVSEQGEDYSIQLELTPLMENVCKQFTDRLMEDWLENASAYGAFVEGELVGVLDLSYESWNRRLRIANILVYEPFRRMNLGTLLMKEAIRIGNLVGARALILETQSCNVPAIRFYRQCGFSLVGFDLNFYGNHDLEMKEVRIEMTRKLSGVTVDYYDIPLRRLVKESMIKKQLLEQINHIDENLIEEFMRIPKTLRQINEVYEGDPIGKDICEQLKIRFEKEDLRRPISMETAFPFMSQSCWKMQGRDISDMKINVFYLGKTIAHLQSVRRCNGTAGYEHAICLELEETVQDKELLECKMHVVAATLDTEFILWFDKQEEMHLCLKKLFLTGSLELF